MKKIPTLYKRDPSNPKLVVNELTPGCEWVVAGEGAARRKYDGTCCAVIDGRLYKRFQTTSAKIRAHGLPHGYIEAQHIEGSGDHFGWLPVGDGPEDCRHRQAWAWHHNESGLLPDGTYELVGPRIQKNPENISSHRLVSHTEAQVYPDAPTTFSELAAWLQDKDIEGLVWHHPDGRMAKIKLRDFNIKRKAQAQ